MKMLLGWEREKSLRGLELKNISSCCQLTIGTFLAHPPKKFIEHVEHICQKHDVTVCPDEEVLYHLRLGSKSHRPVTSTDTQSYDDSN